MQELIKQFSDVGDTVADPFVGSGTSVFAALSTGRKVVAADLNPLAVFLTRSIMELRHETDAKLEATSRFVHDMSDVILPWFHYENDLYVERERFCVDGDFEGGAFVLSSSEVVLKQLRGGALNGRRSEEPRTHWIERELPGSLRTSPIDFKSLTLLPNSRIAIPNGATLADFYEPKNQAAINLALQFINSDRYGNDHRTTLKLLLSASLPLLRLSDKKASSQWPYWRPKQELTSRNPIPIFRKKLQALKHAALWLEEHITDEVGQKLSEHALLHNAPVQSLVPNYISPEQMDLILTDPPYSDQAPYLEYSSLWIQLLDLSLPPDAHQYEIVQTDAPARAADTKDYILRLSEGLRSCAAALKPGGTLVWFYQDHRIEHWAALDEASGKSGLRVQEVIPMSKQRRSMKTVTSPGKTLDGDLILIFKKEPPRTEAVCRGSQALSLIAEEVELLSPTASYFEKYAAVVKVGLKLHLMKRLSDSYSDVREVLTVVSEARNHVLAS